MTLGVWDDFDRRQSARAANNVLYVEGDADMFSRIGVAAE